MEQQIINNIILVQEVIYFILRWKEKRMAVKLNLENAFDMVRHKFIFAIMESFGFFLYLISWIRACIKRPCIYPLVNGRPTSFFQASCGIRKICPLFSFLYLIIVEALSRDLNVKMRNEYLPGISIARGIKASNHEQFVDGTILLGEHQGLQIFALTTL